MTPIGFTGATIDRADAIRQDPEAIARALADPNARLLDLEGLDPVVVDGRLSWTPVPDGLGPESLGLLGYEDGAPRFVRFDPAPPPAPARWEAVLALSPADASLYAGARSLVDWHARHRFCARSGHGTEPFRGGWGRRCGDCGAEHFPRVDPVVIMLAEHQGRVLIGRQPMFPPRRYSALAGFVEPGESVEEAVARELHEEAGVRATSVRYVASQPWPFPSQLMLACIAPVADDTLTIDRTELEDAKWVDRAGVAAALAGDPDAPFIAPPPHAIAYSLFERWLAS
ncbi:NAD(+) diphosphatase [Sphingomonas sp. ID0503]|uniref:NAD(+) diphosphatase n=1 Tax=Sphingomonas sp. ID0503 TaxID=3399691 RepID=UPI003AFACB0B